MRIGVIRGRLAFALTVLAFVYSLALLVVLVAVPDDAGETALEQAALQNLAIFAQPLFVTLALWSLLRERCTTGSDGATVAARTIAAVYLLYSVLGAWTIAVGALPAAFLLFIAAHDAVAGDPRARDGSKVRGCQLT